ncbi:MAG TPA: AAA family ATPase [Xanthobacteraceae bacterium]|nr:AAA family ATPase [Xanthobacteraceae bacterium]
MTIKAFRLFVSSTFTDFAAERDVLQRQVFPALDAYCTAKGYQFYPLDLRWGVNEEAQLDQRTAEICLNEVRAAKQDYPPPNFLILIGNRYGFVPLPYAIAQDEFDAMVAWLEGRNRQDAIGALRSVYRQDSNHLMPPGLSEAGAGALSSAYTLRSRADELPELKSASAWAEREAAVRAALQAAADGLLALGAIEAAAHEKYFLSLTDQEIIHGLPGYTANASGALSAAADGPPAIAFIREIASETGAAPAAIRHYFEQQPRLDALKDAIRRALPEDHVVVASARTDESGRFSEAYLADFAAQIQGKLQSAIDQYIERVEALERAPDFALTNERAAHRLFAERKREIFVGRERELAAIARYLAGAGGEPLVLHGRSGLGKSALLARAIAEAEAGAPIVARFIGATAGSSNLRALLVSVIEDLAAAGVLEKPAEFEQDANKFNAQIEKLLASIADPVIVFLDALDQLQRPRDLWWLPAALPAALKLVIAVLDDPAYETESDLYRSLRDRLPPQAFLEIGPLGTSQGRETLSALERQSRRRLQDAQRDYVIEKFDQAGGSPLYLKAAFEISRSWKSHHAAGAGHRALADDTDRLIAQFIGELSSVHHHEPELVTRTLGYLAAAKNGLSAKELTEILSRDAGVMRAISSERHGALTDKLPPSVWVRLNRELSAFLVEKQIDDQPLLQFFHRQVAQAARAQHYEHCKTELHAALAAYFESQATERDGKHLYAKRCLSELPYQLHHADNAARLGDILMSPDWMQQKLNAFGPRPLIDDYQYARTRAQRLAGQALELAAGPLARDQRQLVAQIIGRVTADLVDDAAGTAEIGGLLKRASALVTPPALVPRWRSLTRPGEPEIRRFEGHTHGVTCVAFSPDGRHIVSGSADKTLRLWEVGTGREIARFEHGQASYSWDHIRSNEIRQEHLELWEAVAGRRITNYEHDGVNAVAFSPDGSQIVSGSEDKTLLLLNVATGQSRRFQGHTSGVTGVAFSPDGRQIISASSGLDRTVRLWDADKGSEITRFEQDGAYSVSFSPDGRHVAFDCGKMVRVWDVVSGKSRRLKGHTRPVRAVAFSPDGRYIASGSVDKTLRLWRATNGRKIRHFEGHNWIVEAVAFSPDGRYVGSGSWDGTVRLWDVASGQSRCFEGHSREVNAVAFSPDGRHLVSGSWDNTVRLWEVGGRQSCLAERHSNRVYALAFSPDGRNIASGGDKTLRLWEAANGQSHCFKGHTGMVGAVGFSPSGHRIVSGSYDATVRVWDRETGESRQLKGHVAEVMTVGFSPDGRYVVSGAAVTDNTLRLWDLANWQSRSLDGHTDAVRAVAFSPDGRQIVSGSVDRTLRLWEAASGQSRSLKGHTSMVGTVAFSPDGRHVVSGSADNTLRLWEATSGLEIDCFAGHSGFVAAVSFSRDGRQIVSASWDNTLRLWEITSRQSRRFVGHSGYVEAVALSRDGRYILSGSRDKTLRLWDAASGSELARIEGESPLHCLALAPDGKSIAAGDAAGRVHLFDILVDESDKIIWLRNLPIGGPAERTTSSQVSSDRAMNVGKPDADPKRYSALRRLLAAFTSKLKGRSMPRPTSDMTKN